MLAWLQEVMRTIVAGLQARGVLTPAGKAQWSVSQVRRLLVRAEAANCQLTAP